MAELRERLWRPAAQRNVRNVWSSIAAARSSWSAASSKGLSAATGFVNVFLTQGYLVSMDLGVLEDMPGLRSASSEKLLCQQRSNCQELVSAYQELEDATSRLIYAAKSMRTYVKDSGSVATFSQEKVFDGDNGDGDGAPVFSMLTIKCYEDLATEITAMYLRELRIKWRIASKLLGFQDNEVLSTENLRALHCLMFCEHELSIAGHCTNHDLPSSALDLPGTKLEREALEVCLTSWLAEAQVEKNRKKACFCSQCLEQPNEISPSSGEFDDGLETIPSSSCFPAGSKSRRRAIKLVTKRCVNCLMGYSADCLALCCCPLSIPHFLFVTLPVLLYRRICKLTTKAKSVSAYQRLGINPDELRKPKDSLLKEDEIPFTGFGGEYWKENFES
ncbi:hypothetical protein SELMODRAFT_405923 [Selaginella moellendorffii]|uniref:Uncharacterized protein n=1 Tax=Selaginella moellendorffii TaxID=88036 RepID=D8R039_SELML|nr:hypothetical protein SELMODRAFT_405923 [Selaginella moellendorffii]